MWPEIVKNDADELVVTSRGLYTSVYIPTFIVIVLIFLILVHTMTEEGLRWTKSPFVDSLLLAVIIPAGLAFSIRLATRPNVTFDKRSKEIRFYGGFLNLSQKHIMFGEVNAVWLEFVSAEYGNYYRVQLIGPRKAIHIVLDRFPNKEKALEFANTVSRAIAAKVTYDG